MKSLPLSVAVLLLLPASALALTADPAALDSATQLVESGNQAPPWVKSAVAVIDLGRPDDVVIGHNLDADWPPASCIKLGVLVAAYDRAASEPGFLDEQITFDKKNATDTWLPPGDTRPLLKAGDVRSVRDLVDLMITRSDNEATNQLLDVLDRTKINAALVRLGFSGIHVNHKLSGGAVSVDDPDALGTNSARVRDVALLLAGIARRTLVSAEASQAMEGHLLGQRDDTMIRKGLPPEVKLAWKSGVTSAVTNAAGIARGPGRAYVLVCFTKFSEGAAQQPMKDFAAAVDAAFKAPPPGAWPVTHSWSDVAAPGSGSYAYELRNVPRTLRVLPRAIRFAAAHGLPVTLTIGGQKVSSTDPRFTSLDDFLALAATATADDLVASSAITSEPASGDFSIAGQTRRFTFLDGAVVEPSPTRGITRTLGGN